KYKDPWVAPRTLHPDGISDRLQFRSYFFFILLWHESTQESSEMAPESNALYFAPDKAGDIE
ncbi:MAG TPA: hypothetical protein VIS57_11565, partial [Xanthomonadales bacterium]